MSVAGVLSEINIYPIKSLGGIKLNKAIITKRGVAHPDNTSVVDRFLCFKKTSKINCVNKYFVIKKMAGSGW